MPCCCPFPDGIYHYKLTFRMSVQCRVTVDVLDHRVLVYIRKVKVRVESAENLLAADMMGSSDPFVKVSILSCSLRLVHRSIDICR